MIFREFEEKKIYLKEQLVAELEEKQRMIEQVKLVFFHNGATALFNVICARLYLTKYLV